MSYGLCNDLYPSPPCPPMRGDDELIGWTATTPYPSTCAYSIRQEMSVIAGAASILFWMLVTMPQLWVNYKLKKAESLSVFFLLQWFGGDITNLIGCFLTHQTPSQTWLAMYYVGQDICLFSQYIYYQKMNYTALDGESEGDDKEENEEEGEEYYQPALLRKKQPSLGDLRRLSNEQLEDGSLNTLASSEKRSSPQNFNNNLDTSLHSPKHASPMRSGSYVFKRTPSGNSGPSNSVGNGLVLKATLAFAGITWFLTSSSLNNISYDNGNGNGNGNDIIDLSIGKSLGVSQTDPLKTSSKRRLLQETISIATNVTGDDRPHTHHPHPPHPPHPPHDHTDAPSSDSDSAKRTYYIGIAIGWVSAVLYLSSRIPQLVKNIQRGSTDGLSPMMFTMAVMGNVTYFLGVILLEPTWDYVLCHLPWIVGSVGTIQFDMIALAQFIYYNGKTPKDPEQEEFLKKEKEKLKHFLEEHHSEAALEVDTVPMVLPHTLRSGAIRNGYYGRIGIWYNE
eukprot:TRINITY_DN4543_c0_g1_i2.p1 TRINITY_DN4543_c0_g1~~TRINITY_DN4543_c0_g1_i2.p1  ORF type:complete len:507 (+),score=95.04 TRINITY_DN4543_c0_g1_i2:46-1566(+)